MKKNKFFLIFFFLYIFIEFNLHSQQTKLIGNFIKLVVDNQSGSFLLYGRNSVKDEWLPLLDKGQQYSTYFRFYLNKIKIPFGTKVSSKRSDIDIIDDKINYFWSNNKIKIEIEYQLVPTENSQYADTLIIDLNLINLTKKMFPVNYLLCFDTYLGEATKQHFILPVNVVVISECKVDLPCEFTNFQSIDRERNIGITVFFDKTQQVAPDNIYFANWKKVYNSKKIYKVNKGARFDFLPGSINDSAAFIEYLDQRVYPDKNNKYRFIVSMKNKIKLEEDYKGEEIIKSLGLKKFQNIDYDKLNLDDLLELLDKINARLKDPDPLKEDEVEVYDKILSEIRKRREEKSK